MARDYKKIAEILNGRSIRSLTGRETDSLLDILDTNFQSYSTANLLTLIRELRSLIAYDHNSDRASRVSILINGAHTEYIYRQSRNLTLISIGIATLSMIVAFCSLYYNTC